MKLPAVVRRTRSEPASRVVRSLAALLATALVPAVAAAQPGMAVLEDPEVAEYRISVPALEAFVRAARAIDVLQEDGLEFAAELEAVEPDDVTLELLVTVFDREPRVRAAIVDEGMTVREYAVFLMAMLLASGSLLEYHLGGPDALPEGALRDNLEILVAHEHLFTDPDDGG
jgi:hypothetical protein